MKKDFKDTIDHLLSHNLTKEQTINKLLFLCSVSSSVKVRIDGYNEPDVEVLSIENDKAICKLANGLEYEYELYRIIRL